MNALEREAPAIVLETDNSEAGEPLPPSLSRVTSLIFSLIVTRESGEHDVSWLYFLIAR